MPSRFVRGQLTLLLVGAVFSILPDRPDEWGLSATVARADESGCLPVVQQAALYEANQPTPDISTAEFAAIVANRSEPVLDVRSAQEYAIAHVPGSINLYEKEVDRITQTFPDRTTRLVLYCNGPFCGKSKRVSEALVPLGYTNVRRYQLGMPMWRALGNTVQTDLDGVRYIWNRDLTAIWVDARDRQASARGTLDGAVSVLQGEAERANEDGRLPQWDKGTRVVVFGKDGQQARAVATEIARKAYWNSSYFGGTYEELARIAVPRDRACFPDRVSLP
jgi:rhodanese-related sulfurtransferase